MTELSKEQDILMMMRKVLANIVKDTTTAPGLKHPLQAHTIQDIRDCFGLIAARERELAEARGVVPERPYYIDETPAAQAVPIASLTRATKPPSTAD